MQYRRPSAPHRQVVHLEPLSRTLSNSLQRRSHCRRLCDTEDFSRAYDRRAGRSTDPRRGHQSHKSSKEWQGCRCRWHPARNLEAWEAKHCTPNFTSSSYAAGNRENYRKTSETLSSSLCTRTKGRVRLLKPQGITLLSIADKIIARVLLNRLIPAVAEHYLPECQCGFRVNRGTTDMVFVLRKLQKKNAVNRTRDCTSPS